MVNDRLFCCKKENHRFVDSSHVEAKQTRMSTSTSSASTCSSTRSASTARLRCGASSTSLRACPGRRRRAMTSAARSADVDETSLDDIPPSGTWSFRPGCSNPSARRYGGSGRHPRTLRGMHHIHLRLRVAAACEGVLPHRRADDGSGAERACGAQGLARHPQVRERVLLQAGDRALEEGAAARLQSPRRSDPRDLRHAADG